MGEWGDVVFVTGNQAMLVVRSAEGFTVVELLGDEGSVQVGDKAFGNWSASGGESLIVRKNRLDGYFQATHGDFGNAVATARRLGGE